MFGPWFNLAMLAAESQQVIGIRMLQVASGRCTAAEASRMVTEKVAAAQSAAFQLATGASPDSVVRGYRTKVQENARRLLR